MEEAIENQKKAHNEKLEQLESQITTVTADLAKIKEGDKDQELEYVDNVLGFSWTLIQHDLFCSSKLAQLGDDIDKKLDAAEAKVNEFKELFDQFQEETNEQQAK